VIAICSLCSGAPLYREGPTWRWVRLAVVLALTVAGRVAR